VIKVVVGAVVLTVVLLGLLGTVVVVSSWYLLTGGVATVAAPAIGGQLARAGGWAALNPPVAPTGAPSGVPAEQWAVMLAVAKSSTCGVTAQDLAAIASVESGFGRNMATSSAGAIGYAQFLPGTWARYGQGDPYAFGDALPAIDRLLCADSYAANRTAALNRYGGCTTPACLGSGSYADAVDRFVATLNPAPMLGVIGQALGWLGAPYAWGGTSKAGVDCSGLVQQVYAAVGVGLPRTAAGQWAATQHVGQPRAGDLILFHDTDPADPGVDHVGLVVDPAQGTMIDAPTDGIPVRVESFLTPYWQSHLEGFGRIEP
jgi:cell wall-associated NlpC family hydrolase